MEPFVHFREGGGAILLGRPFAGLFALPFPFLLITPFFQSQRCRTIVRLYTSTKFQATPFRRPILVIVKSERSKNLKLIIFNFTLIIRTPSHDHIFLHLLSCFWGKKIEKWLPGPRFEPTTFMLEGEGAYHYTMDP